MVGRVSEKLIARLRHYEELLGVDQAFSQLDAALFGIGLLRCELASVEETWRPPKPAKLISWSPSFLDHTFASAGQRAACARNLAHSNPQLAAYTEMREAVVQYGCSAVDMHKLRSTYIHRDCTGKVSYCPSYVDNSEPPTRRASSPESVSPPHRASPPRSKQKSPTRFHQASPPRSRHVSTPRCSSPSVYVRPADLSRCVAKDDKLPLAAMALAYPIDRAVELTQSSTSGRHLRRYTASPRRTLRRKDF